MCLGLLGPSGAQTPAAPALGEGALRNDVALSVDEEAAAALVRGDEAMAVARSGGASAPGALRAACDAWASALERAAPGALVPAQPRTEKGHPWPDPDGTLARRGEGVHGAVQRRLLALEAQERVVWRERVSERADELLRNADLDPRKLAEVEHRFPLTSAGAIAALRQCDAALEAGRHEAARTALARCAGHARELDAGLDFERHIAHRREVLRRGDPSADRTREAWRDAERYELVRSVRLESRSGSVPPGQRPPLGLGQRPGLAFAADGGVHIQTPFALISLSREFLAGRTGASVAPLADLLAVVGLRPWFPPSTGGWPALPARDASGLALVVDRGSPGRIRLDLPVPARGNHLAWIEFDDAGVARLGWRNSGGWRGRAGESRAQEVQVLGPGTFEFQPGPLLVDELLIVLARCLNEPLDRAEPGAPLGRIELVAFESRTGNVRWRTPLSQAADLARPNSPIATGEATTAGMPLAFAEGHVLLSTNSGLCASVAAADGRVDWVFKVRRRAAEEPGWPGSRRPLLGDERAWFAPADSTHVYSLPIGPWPGPGLEAFAVLERASALDLAAPANGGALVLDLDGRHGTLREWRGARPVASGLYLARGEQFSGSALCSERRALLATDAAFHVFDREAELRLSELVPLPDLGAGVGGDVYARGNLALVLGTDTLWVLAARP